MISDSDKLTLRIDSLLKIGAVVVTIAVSVGGLYVQVANLKEDVSDVKDQLAGIDNKLDVIGTTGLSRAPWIEQP